MAGSGCQPGGKCLTFEPKGKFREIAVAVKGMTILWRWLRTRPSPRRVHLALAVRITVAAILSLVAAQQLGLPLPLWAVLTAMIVTQMSVGRSLKATGDYLAGTVGGAIYGGLVAVLIPHEVAGNFPPGTDPASQAAAGRASCPALDGALAVSR